MVSSSINTVRRIRLSCFQQVLQGQMHRTLQGQRAIWLSPALGKDGSSGGERTVKKSVQPATQQAQVHSSSALPGPWVGNS